MLANLFARSRTSRTKATLLAIARETVDRIKTDKNPENYKAQKAMFVTGERHREWTQEWWKWFDSELDKIAEHARPEDQRLALRKMIAAHMELTILNDVMLSDRYSDTEIDLLLREGAGDRETAFQTMMFMDASFIVLRTLGIRLFNDGRAHDWTELLREALKTSCEAYCEQILQEKTGKTRELAVLFGPAKATVEDIKAIVARGEDYIFDKAREDAKSAERELNQALDNCKQSVDDIPIPDILYPFQVPGGHFDLDGAQPDVVSAAKDYTAKVRTRRLAPKVHIIAEHQIRALTDYLIERFRSASAGEIYSVEGQTLDLTGLLIVETALMLIAMDECVSDIETCRRAIREIFIGAGRVLATASVEGLSLESINLDEQNWFLQSWNEDKDKGSLVGFSLIASGRLFGIAPERVKLMKGQLGRIGAKIIDNAWETYAFTINQFGNNLPPTMHP